MANPTPYLPGVPSSSAIARYDPYAPPRKATHSAVPSTSMGSKPTGVYRSVLHHSPTHHSLGIRFKESPFFRMEGAVSSIIECPGLNLHIKIPSIDVE
jgi:E3 SUMO-protein ligase PIAS1